MKKFLMKISLLAMAVVTAFAFVGCGDNAVLTDKANQGISAAVGDKISAYDGVAYYELETPGDVTLKFAVDEIQKVSFKYRVLDDKDWSLKNNVLTIKSNVFKGETAGDKKLRVFVENAYTEITVRVVTKVIMNTTDFNGIRNNMNGTYVLGADIDFANEPFWPIGKSIDANGGTKSFEGVLDGMGHSVKNITVNAFDRGLGEDGEHQGPSLGGEQANGRNYNNGIFMSTSGNSKILNTNFVNITVKSQGLSGAIVGANGGLIKNCMVSCDLESKGFFERAGGITGVNGSSDSAGRIENCVVLYSWSGNNPARGFADWNNGIIKNSYAELKDDYVFNMGYDSETQSIPADFDYDKFITADNYNDYGFGWYTTPAFPGAMDTANGIYYKGGDIDNADVVRKEVLLDPANFSENDGWDTSIWNFVYGAFPTLKIQKR